MEEPKIISKKEVLETIGFRLEDSLSSYGFKYIKSKSHLIKKFNGGFYRILFTTYDGFPVSHQELNIQFIVRLNEIEEIVSRFYNERFRNPEFSKLSDTINCDFNCINKGVLENILPPKPDLCKLCKKDNNRYFVIHESGDIDIAAEQLKSFIKSNGLDFFEKFTNTQKLNEWFKQKLLSSNYPLDLLEVMHSLILMKRTKDSDYESILKIYSSRLKPNIGFEVETNAAFKEIIDYLN